MEAGTNGVKCRNLLVSQVEQLRLKAYENEACMSMWVAAVCLSLDKHAGDFSSRKNTKRTCTSHPRARTHITPRLALRTFTVHP